MFKVKNPSDGIQVTVDINVDTPYCDSSTKQLGCAEWLAKVIPVQIKQILMTTKRRGPSTITVDVTDGVDPLHYVATKTKAGEVTVT